MSILTISIQHCTRCSNQCSKARKINTGHSDGGGRSEAHYLLTTDHPWRKFDGYTKLLELINGFSKDTRYKIDIEKSSVFLYFSNKQLEIEI